MKRTIEFEIEPHVARKDLRVVVSVAESEGWAEENGVILLEPALDGSPTISWRWHNDAATALMREGFPGSFAAAMHSCVNEYVAEHNEELWREIVPATVGAP